MNTKNQESEARSHIAPRAWRLSSRPWLIGGCLVFFRALACKCLAAYGETSRKKPAGFTPAMFV